MNMEVTWLDREETVIGVMEYDTSSDSYEMLINMTLNAIIKLIPDATHITMQIIQ